MPEPKAEPKSVLWRETCFYYTAPTRLMEGVGTPCRRYPPKTLVQESDWCGEWKAKSEKNGSDQTP